MWRGCSTPSPRRTPGAGLFDNMRETARARGCIGAHGSLKRAMTAHAYATRGVFFYYAGGLMPSRAARTSAAPSKAARLFLGGFAGDRWTRLASDPFG